MSETVIKVVGVGNGGVNAVSQIVRSQVAGVQTFALDTDHRKLLNVDVPNTLVIGDDVTEGLGCGGDPEKGRQAAESSAKEIEAVLAGSDMVFVTAAMGGGTGTGAAPVICRIARDLGALTVGLCTKPFLFERQRRMATAQMGIEECAANVDAIITVDNQRLFEQVDKHTRLTDAFGMVDDVLRQAVQGISDLIFIPGMINVDFNDAKSVLQNAGPVLMGMGEASTETSSSEIVSRVISSPLLDNGIVGATQLLLNITGGPELTLWQVNELAGAVAQATQTDETSTIFGTVIDPAMAGRLRLTILAASFIDTVAAHHAPHGSSRPLHTPARRPAPAPTPTYTPRSTPPPAPAPAPTPPPAAPAPPADAGPATGDDLDMPTFVRRNLERRRRDS